MSQYRFDVPPSPLVQVRVSAGRLDLTPSLDGTVTVDLTGTGADLVTVEQLGDTVVIRQERTLFGGRSVNIRAAVPAGTNLEAVVASMDIFARVDLGRVVGRTASGDIDLGAVHSVEVKTASGDVKVDVCSASCEVTSASGDVRIHDVVGDLVVSTASGDVDIDRSEGRAEAKTASGDINLRCCTGPQVEASSMSGDLSVGVPEGTRVEAEIDSLSGNVRLPPRRQGGGDPERRMRLRAKTVSGDISLVRTGRVA